MFGMQTESSNQGTQGSSVIQKGNRTIGGHIEIEPHFGDNIELFDNEEMFPDFEFMIPGCETSLHLHKLIIARASKLMQGLIKAKQLAKNQDENQVEWMFDTSEKIDRDALVKVLRFCYGENMRIGTTDCECCAVIAALYRLQVTCADEIIKELIDDLVDCTKNNPPLGAMLLKGIQSYPECCSTQAYELDKALAEVVFTRKNICEYPETLVSECLMKLPPVYLDIVEYGEPHTQWSEFNVRMQYLKEHSEDLSQEEKDEIMRRCNTTFLWSGELSELRKLNAIGKDLMLDMYDSVLKHTEKEKSGDGMKIFGVVQERDTDKK